MLALDFRFVVWPDAPLDAAKYFHETIVPQVREAFGGSGAFAEIAEVGDHPEVLEAVAIILPPAAHPHHSWRLAATQELAREAAPRRVNSLVGHDDDAINDAVEWLAGAPGITGQLLPVGRD